MTAKPAANMYRGEQTAMQYIPYRHHVTDTIISTDNGEFLTSFRLQGRTHSTASDEEIIRWHADLNQLLKQVGNENVSLWTHLYHRKVDVYREGRYPSSFAQRLDQNYAAKFKAKPAMVNDLYLTVVYNPIGDATQRHLSKLEKASVSDMKALRDEAIEQLEDIASQIRLGMQLYGVEQLGVYYRDESGNIITDAVPDDDDDDDDDDLLASEDYQRETTPEPVGRVHAYSEPLELFGFLVNGEWEPMPVCQGIIKGYLQSSRTVSSHWGDIIQVRRMDDVIYTAGIELRDYEAQTEPGQFNKFLSADFEFVLTQTFNCMSQGQAKSFLTKRQAALLETDDLAKSQTAALSGAADHLVSGDFILGWHHANVHVLGSTAKQALGYARQARNMLNTCGVIASPIGLASEAAYYARLPGNRSLIPRPAGVTSINFLCFSSFHNLHTGKPTHNPWGEAVTMFKTTAGSPLFFNFHSTPQNEDSFGKRPAGHTLFLGKTGEGKTTLMNAILAWSTKFNPRMFIFDRDRGMQQMVMALGGHYRVMRESEPSGMQPLQMEPTRNNIAFVKRLVRVLAETSKNDKLDPNEITSLTKAVDAVMGANSRFERRHRTMSAVRQQIPSPKRTRASEGVTLAELLSPWCQGGEHGWLFDNAADEIDLGVNDIIGFDISDFIVEQDEPAPESRMPMLMYLLYRMRKAVDGKRPVIKVFDEFSTYLDDPIMDIEIKRGLKTDRKKQGVYVFATQEPNDALESRIGKTVVQQVVTKAILSTPGASREDFVNGLRLTEEEFRQVEAIPEKSYQFLLKQGSLSAMAKFDLSGMEKEISILSGTPDQAELCETICDELGTSDPDVWLPEYWKRMELQ